MDVGADRFFDVETGGPLQLQLQQSGTGFRVLRQIGYRDPRYRDPFIVPADTDTFETDLASVPWFFAWLVPGFGTHVPAAVVHDGLVFTEAEGRTYLGPDVDRVEADRILREGTGSLGTPRIRRWIMWAAVILATAFSTLRPRWRWIGAVLATVVPIVVLGVIATLDLLDVWDVLPWMGDRAWWAEVLAGALFALLIPLAIAALWGGLWPAGAIVGVMLTFLLHVTALIVALYGVYWLAETFISRPEGTGPNVRRSYLAAVSRRDG